MSIKHSNKVTTRARLIYGRQVKTCGYPNWFCSNSKLNYLSCNRVIFLNIMHIENIGMSMVKASLAFLLFLTVTILTIRGGTLRSIYTSKHSTNQHIYSIQICSNSNKHSKNSSKTFLT